MTDIHIRPLREEEAAISAALYREELPDEFLARCGQKFLTCYHRAWITSPAGQALTAVDEDDNVVGILFAAIDPFVHFAHIFHRFGLALTRRLVIQAIIHPTFGRLLIVTRGRRYIKAAMRMFKRKKVPIGDRSGEITFLLIKSTARKAGIGGALLAEIEKIARKAGLDELVLVTPRNSPAIGVYEHLGWHSRGAIRTLSGEEFVHFYLPLAGSQN